MQTNNKIMKIKIIKKENNKNNKVKMIRKAEKV